MNRLPLAALVLTLSSPALAGDAEITLKLTSAASMGLALDGVASADGWVAVDAEPEPMAARTKADILIESLGATTEPLAVGYDPGLLSEPMWGASDDGWFAIYAVDALVVDAAAVGGFVVPLDGRIPGSVVAPRDLGWEDVAIEHEGYLLVAPDGAATLVFPTSTNLIGVEPDEID